MKKITAIVAFTLAVLVGTLHDAAAQESPSVGIGDRFSEVMRAYAKSPGNVDVLFDMAKLYSDTTLPTLNLPLAMTFANKAETNYLTLMRDNKHSELTRLLRLGILLTTVQHLKESLHNAALRAVKDGADTDLMELDDYLEVFADDAEIVGIVRQRRIRQVYEADMKAATPQSYYHIISMFPGTKEADQAEAKLSKLAASLFVGDENIDSVAALYAASPSVARAAERKKSRMAFTQATSENTIAAYKAFLRQYPSSDESQQVRDALDNLLAIQFGNLHTAKELADFADSNDDNDLADRALAEIRRIIRDKHDVQAARLYLDRYRLDPHWGEVYTTYYNWHADEGNGELLARFEEENPDSPLQLALERDQERTMILDNIELMDDYSEDEFATYSRHIHQSVGKKISFVPLQRMLQQLTLAGDYTTAAARMSQFEICFDNVMYDEYNELQQLLTAPASGIAVLQLGLEGEILNPCYNAGDNLLYYNGVRSSGLTLCYATADYEYGGQVEITGDKPEGLTLFGFYDGGDKMLLGHDGDILIAERDGSAWRISDIPPYPINTDYIETDASMLPDGSGMLLASDRPGGQNLQPSGTYYHGDTALATDLWFIPLHDGRWGTPINLGIGINTPYCERSPRMGSDLRTLYYVTDSRGMGYGDIYTATRTGIGDWTSWSEPRNLGREVNTSFNEASVSLSPDEQQLYLSTNAGGHYVCRIATLPQKPATSLMGYSLDVMGIEESLFRLLVADINQQQVTQTVEYGGEGSTVVLPLHKDKSYAIFAEAADRFIPAIIVDPQHRPQRLYGYTHAMLLSLDKAVPLEAVDFSTGTAAHPSDNTHPRLTSVAAMQMEQLVQFLDSYPASVEIDVDVAGLDDAIAYAIALERGRVIKDYLSAKGIDGRRITVSAYGNVRTKRGTPEGVSVQFR